MKNHRNDPVLERNVRELGKQGLDFLAIAIAEELKHAFGDALQVATRKQKWHQEQYTGILDVGCPPFYPQILFTLGIEKRRPINGVYPVTLEVRVDYGSTIKAAYENGAKSHSPYLKDLQDAKHDMGRYVYSMTIPLEWNPDHPPNHYAVHTFVSSRSTEEGVTFSHRFTHREDISTYLPAFLAIPEAIKKAGDGASLREYQRMWLQALRIATERNAQGVGASVPSSALLSTAQS